jgi:hypothetical protein
VSIICCAVPVTSGFQLHLIDATISDLRLEVEDPDGLFGSVLEAARGGAIAVDLAHRLTFMAIWAALWNSDTV